MATHLAVVGRSGLHVGIIMDGNGRWAERRHWPRVAGHPAGAAAVRRIVEAAPGLGVGTLTLYAFSADNWRRPRDEVRRLMALLREYLRDEVARCVQNGVRLTAIGRRDRLPASVFRALEEAEAATAQGRRLHLRLALDYSARDAIVAAACSDHPPRTREEFEQRLAGDGPAEVDLLIRTGGEQRLSDFLLWECAYAELWFTPVCWPDFEAAHLAEAIRGFEDRDRRFGGLSPVRESGGPRRARG
jgi:undecaprenyl diphosphate synthase